MEYMKIELLDANKMLEEINRIEKDILFEQKAGTPSQCDNDAKKTFQILTIIKRIIEASLL